MTDPVAADVATAERRPAGDRPAAGPPGRAACAGRPGRPRSAAADTAILDATIDLFAECGFEGVTMEAVAERAGVAKSTVYRRYPSKLDMIMAAWSDCSPDGDEVDVDTGSLELDLRSAAARLRRVFGSDPVGRAAQVFFLCCIIVAGLYGAATVNRRILFVQTVPAAIGLLLVLLS